MPILEINVNVFHHFPSCDRKQDEILQQLKELRMSLSQEFLDLNKKIDDATNAVATRITNLQGQIKNSMTDDEVANVKAGMQAEIDKLTALGKDPANPVPPAPAPATP